MKLPKKVLIANRGEIALRVVRTCRRLGIQTVAVFSDPDRRSLHVESAGEAVGLGGATAMESYLDQELVLEAAKRTACDAVHPGYGFLSENSAFASRVADAGLVFVGPPADAIKLLGDKISAKQAASRAGIPTVPGLEEPVADARSAREAAAEIGYPVLLKPSAGGGGKGMRIVASEDEVADALEACQSEASKAFGDDRVFVERYVAHPRHIEIQVLADSYGSVIHLNERECSIQRRYQKVIEEAPSPVVDPELRARMGDAACALAHAAGYVNAGTVEFLLDGDGNFYFLEMNTRLQVEHPVTELTTGLDLVEHQLRIAAGERLALRQEDVHINGWAIEARICAENPQRDFAPSAGTILRYAEPKGNGVRVDSGVRAGSDVSVYYDSMLAKVIAHGDSREQARRRLVDALNGCHIAGLSTNVDFANSILNHPEFIAGELSTDFIAANYSDGESSLPPPVERLHKMAVAALLVYHQRRALVADSLQPMVATVGGVKPRVDSFAYILEAESCVFQIRLSAQAQPRHWQVEIDQVVYDVATPEFEFYRRRLRLDVNGRRERFLLHYEDSFIAVAHCGIRRRFEIYSPREWSMSRFMPEPIEYVDTGAVQCPMPGLVVAIGVEVGDQVHTGDLLLTLESMKMQSGVPAPRGGRVAQIHVSEGQTVDTGDALVEIEV